MASVKNDLNTLNQEIEKAWTTLGLSEISLESAKLQQKSQQADFWEDSENAQKVMKRIASLQTKLDPWQDLKKSTSDLLELSQLEDSSLNKEIEQSFEVINKKYQELKKVLAFNGAYDVKDVILSIYAGAGGTDAQDWAQMLLRMYTRWAETTGGKVSLLDQSSGDEAGIKSVTISVEDVPYAYGKLKGEHGVHRLVRLSPFNSDNLRQTSFAKVEVIPQIDQPDEVVVDEKDLRVDVFRAGGHGGQSVNTTDSAVRVTHIPTNITVSIQNERSQIQNKETAMTILRSKLAQLSIEQHQEKISDLKGPAQAVEWGSQIRNYVLHPYKQVKDLRTHEESKDPDKVLDGKIDEFINAYTQQNLSL